MLARRCSAYCRTALRGLDKRTISNVETDSYGIPLKPTWSVNELLSSYPTPSISPSTLKRLHELSALIPPEEGTHRHDELRHEMEDLIRLVEAVKLIDTCSTANERSSTGRNEAGSIPDGRIWAKGLGMRYSDGFSDDGSVVTGEALQKQAARISEGMYVVESERMK